MHSSDNHLHHGDGSFSFQYLRINPQGEITHREQGSAVYRRLDLGQGLSLDLVWVPGGTFTMGSPALEPPLERRYRIKKRIHFQELSDN
jgi:formylglycine-generating enzyme required for sulfatase activity